MIHCRRFLFLFHRDLIEFNFVWLCQLLHSKFFVILLLLGSILRDLPEKLCFSDLILQIANSLPFEPDQAIDSPVRAPLSRIQAVGFLHEEQYQHFAFLILFCPFQTALQIILSEPQVLLEKLDPLSCQGTHEGFSGPTDFSPFPFEKVARSHILDFVHLLTYENVSTHRTGFPMLENKSVSRTGSTAHENKSVSRMGFTTLQCA